MALRDEIKRERKAFFATATPKEKFKYLVEYYGLRVVVIVVALILGINLLIQVLTKPTPVLNGNFFNMAGLGTEDIATQLGNDFLKAKNLNEFKYSVSFNTNMVFSEQDDFQNYNMTEALYAQIAAKSVDFIVGTSDEVLSLAYNEVFTDLSTILTEEQMKQYEPCFRYIDQALVTARREDETTDKEAYDIPIPDCTKPEAMEQPLPVFIDVSQSKSMQEMYKNNTDGLCYGIVVNGSNQKNAIEFLEFITK